MISSIAMLMSLSLSDVSDGIMSVMLSVMFLSEQLIEIPVVNWYGNKKNFELKLSLFYLNSANICKSFGVQEKIILVVL